jgi:hypothetical protein
MLMLISVMRFRRSHRMMTTTFSTTTTTTTSWTPMTRARMNPKRCPH